jgi:hypothetical protein
MDRRETQAPEELQPHEEAALLVQQARRRRARFRFTLAVFAGLATIGWLAGQLLLPDMPTPVLSAKPAPSEPALAARWASLLPMQRTHESDSLAAGDSLAALLTRAGIDDVEADAALDALRAVFDPRKLKVGQKVRIFREWPNNIPADKRAEDNTKRFAGFDFIPEPRQRLVVRRTGPFGF